MREPANAPVPGTATVEVADEAAPVHAEEIPTYSRSVFLELGTLGLGGVIGGLVTLPALGFAVLPAFEHHKQPTSTSDRSRTSRQGRSSCRPSSRIRPRAR